MIKVAIVDDHAIFRNGFKLLFENQAELEFVGEAGGGPQLLSMMRTISPDVVIMDVMMPGMDGVACCKELKKDYSNVEVIALSMLNEDHLIMDMLSAGAKGYLLKNTTQRELIHACQSVHGGGRYYCDDTSQSLARLIAQAKFNPKTNQQTSIFTPRELDVIRLICAQKSSKEIALELGIGLRTVESYRESILEKSGAKNSIGIVVYALQNNLFIIK